jgi:sugar O-acyltransferase (sialic acid O-acetyltransferase NeuD family)
MLLNNEIENLPRINVIGAGGHARVILSIFSSLKATNVLVFDDYYNESNMNYHNLKVVGPISSDITGNTIIAIGSNNKRKYFRDYLKNAAWINCIHEKAIIDSTVLIGEGTVVMAGVIIQPGAKIGRHCIINTGACIDHDCVVGDFCHIGPNAALGGGVNVGEGSFIGIGSSVIPYITIGQWSTIEAGSSVNQDISDNCIVEGIPAVLKLATKKYKS